MCVKRGKVLAFITISDNAKATGEKFSNERMSPRYFESGKATIDIAIEPNLHIVILIGPKHRHLTTEQAVMDGLARKIKITS